jgi:DNA-nicking Smr family endonuclease
MLGKGIMAEDDPVKIPIDGLLDLHTFNPKDVKDLVPEYLRECRSQGIYHVRIIHGKGTGTLRRIVHGILEKHPHVISFKTAHYGRGGWGATEVELSPR